MSLGMLEVGGHPTFVVVLLSLALAIVVSVAVRETHRHHCHHRLGLRHL